MPFNPDDLYQELTSEAAPESAPLKNSAQSKKGGLNFLLESAGLPPVPEGESNPLDLLSHRLKIKEANMALENVAALGRFANRGNQLFAETLAEKGGIPGAVAGTALGTASEFLLPKDRLSAALLPLAATVGKPRPVQDIAKKIVRPGSAAKLGGALITTTTAIPQRYSSAVLADVSILSKETPSVTEVGKEYAEAFKKAGMKINDKVLKDVTGSRLPGTSEGKLTSIVNKALDALDNKALSENEAFIARQAAAQLQRTPKAEGSRSLMRSLSEAKDKFDSVLESSSLPNIRELSTKYFRAVAKEHFESFLPKNKNLSPNALRSLVMLKLAADSVGSLASGVPARAAGQAVQAAAMSPLLVASGIRAGKSLVTARPAARQAAILSTGPLTRSLGNGNP